MLVLLFCKLYKQYSQTNFPVINIKLYKVTKYKKRMADIWVIRTKIYITNTHNTQIKQTVFSGTIGVFNQSIQEIE